jgi:hypothetical protein
MARKQDKVRPYRVDWFDINEMIDNDKALVRSIITRAVTAEQARHDISGDTSAIVTIRAYRFYKKLLRHRKDVYKAVEDLFTAKDAVKVMEQVEEYRKKKIDEQFAAAAGTFPADPLADVKVIDPGPNCWSGGLKIPIPTTGPDSLATKAVVADLQGMVAHDEHEKVMDTFVPLPGQGADYVDKNAVLAAAPLVAHTPFLTTCPVCDGPCKGDYSRSLPEHGDDIAAALTAVEVKTCVDEQNHWDGCHCAVPSPTTPINIAPPPDRIVGGDSEMPLGLKLTLFGIAGFFLVVIVLAILSSGSCH